MEYRPTNKPDPIIHCDCGHSVPESEMVNAFMGKSTPRNVCDACYDEWAHENEEKEKTINEVFRNAFNDFIN